MLGATPRSPGTVGVLVRRWIVIGLLVLWPATASASGDCFSTEGSFEQGRTSPGCPPGTMTLEQSRRDAAALNALAARGQAAEQRNSDIETIHEMESEWKQVEPDCVFIEHHPLKARMRALAEGKPLSSVSTSVKACHQLKQLLSQAEDVARQQGLIPGD